MNKQILDDEGDEEISDFEKEDEEDGEEESEEDQDKDDDEDNEIGVSRTLQTRIFKRYAHPHINLFSTGRRRRVHGIQRSRGRSGEEGGCFRGGG